MPLFPVKLKTFFVSLPQAAALLTLLSAAFVPATALAAPAGPWAGSAPNLPATLIGSNYDLGGSGVGFNFPQTGSSTSTYRVDGGANLKANSDATTANPW